MLTGDSSVQVFKIETEYGDCDLYVLPLSEDEEALATHKCVMVRHPLMKIKAFDLGASFRVSALCIIDDGVLGKVLRDIENTEHNDWQTKRIKDKTKRREIENVIASIRQQITDRIIECLQMGDLEPIDPNGAGDFLPDIDPGEGKTENEVNNTPAERVNVVSVKENTVNERNAIKYIDEFFHVDTEMSPIQKKNSIRMRDDLIERYFEAPDLQYVGRNAYRFINAVSDFVTHAEPSRKTKNYRENLFLNTAEGNPMIDKAYRMMLAA